MSFSNLEIGQRLKQARKLRSLSQQKVGDMLGVSFQQVQKYENGTNRISVKATLKLKEHGIDLLSSLSNQVNPLFPDQTLCLDDSELQLLRSYREIKNSTVRNKVLHLMKAMTSEE